ncbi:carboxymuconolactone decarboxylase family protein [Sphingobium fuliginis]|jgi:4-carboxymuconolactone decarboxylase|uniref:Carboxymuconolactone decarboxylase family protein n=1 Tax=Sphingobium fuliginis ATCC 27551 TaxID=1208342 RepID=A0A5B8CL12_SPHSA|nr:carboxymuconolactone decarboxylase family protein [Sphingobium fuliginis ATCC 27551]RYL98007.1 carboxymuconolactone decarboxylase family protein [Sphingobium fuliginis]
MCWNCAKSAKCRAVLGCPVRKRRQDPETGDFVTRIPYPDPAGLSETKREVLSGAFGRVLNISRMAMHAPDPFWAPQRALGRAAIFDISITPRQRELIILRVAYLSRSDYEIYHHESIAAALGLTERERQGLESGDFSVFAAEEQCLCDFVSELVSDVSPSDRSLAAMQEYFGLPTLFEILFITCTYMMLARVAAVSGAEIDDEAVTNWNLRR